MLGWGASSDNTERFLNTDQNGPTSARQKRTHLTFFVSQPSRSPFRRVGGAVKAAKRRREALTAPPTLPKSGSGGSARAKNRRRGGSVLASKSGSILVSIEDTVFAGLAGSEKKWQSRKAELMAGGRWVELLY